MLTANGCKWVFEGSNMPTTSDAIDHLKSCTGVVYFPGKVKFYINIEILCFVLL